MSKSPEREWCDRCQRWLAHDKGLCPLFPGYRAWHPITSKLLPKWSECPCLIHTCYEASPRENRENALTVYPWED